MTLFPGVALVTGAGSGIGQAVAISFAREGCQQIVVLDVNENGLAETEKLMKDVAPGAIDVERQRMNVLDESEVAGSIDNAVQRFQRVDYAVNCAGVLGNGEPSHGTSTQDFDRINGVNYRGCWLSSREEIKQMKEQEPLPSHDGRPGARGSIVNIASQLGIVGRPEAPAYCGSKAAVISMTRCDAIDYSKDSIRINCVCPGVIDTPMTRPRMDILKGAIGIAPMNRPGTAQEVADCVLFLCSSKASFVQGSAMVVDGGYIIN